MKDSTIFSCLLLLLLHVSSSTIEQTCSVAPSLQREEAKMARVNRILNHHEQDWFVEHSIPEKIHLVIVLGFGKPVLKGKVEGLEKKAKKHVAEAVKMVADVENDYPRFLLFTGGYGEALMMATESIRKLAEQGVDIHPLQVTAETASRTTVENALNSLAMVEDTPAFHGTKFVSVSIMASPWHVPRAKLIFDAIWGIPTVAHPVKWQSPKTESRDFIDKQVIVLGRNVEMLRDLGYQISNKTISAVQRAIEVSSVPQS